MSVDLLPSALLLVTALGFLVMIAGVVWLARAHLALRREHLALSDKLEAYRNDLAGLCTAALAMDRHMDMNDAQLQQLMEQIASLPTTSSATVAAPSAVSREPSPAAELHPYGSVIQKVRSGASIAELMQSAGLSHDEAALLIRLHGANNS